MKVVNDLLGYTNVKIVQDTDFFKFSLDSVLLPNFVSLQTTDKNILDIGTGNAPIPLILSIKSNSMIYAFEIQKEIYKMAFETVKLNKLLNRISVINDDVKNIGNYFSKEMFDVIVTNPPYFKVSDKSVVNLEITKAIARHELKLNLDDIVKISSQYLKNKGRFAMVYRTERMAEVFSVMRMYAIEPKRLKIIFPKRGMKSNLFLVEGVKNGNSGLKEVTSIVIHDDNGDYTEEVQKYFS